jgi:hypothetical protein
MWKSVKNKIKKTLSSSELKILLYYEAMKMGDIKSGNVLHKKNFSFCKIFENKRYFNWATYLCTNNFSLATLIVYK